MFHFKVLGLGMWSVKISILVQDVQFRDRKSFNFELPLCEIFYGF